MHIKQGILIIAGLRNEKNRRVRCMKMCSAGINTTAIALKMTNIVVTGAFPFRKFTNTFRKIACTEL